MPGIRAENSAPSCEIPPPGVSDHWSDHDELLDSWGQSYPTVVWDDFCEAFPLDDEMGEPEPQYGDFWGELDDGELDDEEI